MSITRIKIKLARQALKPLYPQVKSAHLAEAYAYGLGFNTSIALMTAVDAGTVPALALNVQRFHQRLNELGYSI